MNKVIQFPVRDPLNDCEKALVHLAIADASAAVDALRAEVDVAVGQLGRLLQQLHGLLES
jgi:hypothetical protein